jgi:hypothetical protein
MRAPAAGSQGGEASRNSGAGGASVLSNEAIVSDSQIVLAAVVFLLLLTGLMQRMVMILMVAGLFGTLRPQNNTRPTGVACAAMVRTHVSGR